MCLLLVFIIPIIFFLININIIIPLNKKVCKTTILHYMNIKNFTSGILNQKYIII